MTTRPVDTASTNYVLYAESDGRLRYFDPETNSWLLNQMEERAARESAEVRLAEMTAELRRLRGE